MPGEGADAGIILTASHNPKQWNALKLLNARGEFISAQEGAEVLRIAERVAGIPPDLQQLNKRSVHRAMEIMGMRAAMEILMAQLGLRASDLQRIILTGSFGAQLDIDAVLGVGLLPPVPRAAVETIPNGAGLGAAMFLTDEGFAWSERLAARAEQVNLDQDADFMQQYIQAMAL